MKLVAIVQNDFIDNKPFIRVQLGSLQNVRFLKERPSCAEAMLSFAQCITAQRDPSQRELLPHTLSLVRAESSFGDHRPILSPW
jgi:hypothetical protein